MLIEIKSEPKTMKNISKVTSDQVLGWARQAEAHRRQMVARSKSGRNEQVDTMQPEK